MSHKSSGSEGTSNCQDNYNPLSVQGLRQRFSVYDTDKENFISEENHKSLESNEFSSNKYLPSIPPKPKKQRDRNDCEETSRSMSTNSDKKRDLNDHEKHFQSMDTKSYEQQDRNDCEVVSKTICTNSWKLRDDNDRNELSHSMGSNSDKLRDHYDREEHFQSMSTSSDELRDQNHFEKVSQTTGTDYNKQRHPNDREEPPQPMGTNSYKSRGQNDFVKSSQSAGTNSCKQRQRSYCEKPSQSIGADSNKQRCQNGCDELSQSMCSNILLSQLYSIGLEHDQIDYIVENKEKFIDRPGLLSRKLKISEGSAISVLDILKTEEQDQVDIISKEIQETIEKCIEENPDFTSIEDIAILCDINESVDNLYFESKPMNEQQIYVIKTKYNAGYHVAEIADLLKVSTKKVQKYVDSHLLTFSGKEGRKVQKIIHKHFGEMPPFKLRKNIISKDLKLQDQLCCILQRSCGDEYMEIKNYFKMFEESKSFFELDKELTFQDISYIDKHSNDSVEQLSIKLQKVESVIIDYLNQYDPTEINRKSIEISQKQKINQIQQHFGNKKFTFESYRMIIANTFEDMMQDANAIGKTPSEIFKEFLPLPIAFASCIISSNVLAIIILYDSNVSFLFPKCCCI